MDDKEIQALKDQAKATQDQLEALKNTIRDSTRPWRHDRWESIKKDPQAAFSMFVAGAAAWWMFGDWALKQIGF